MLGEKKEIYKYVHAIHARKQFYKYGEYKAEKCVIIAVPMGKAADIKKGHTACDGQEMDTLSKHFR
ncbi:hypothetical protein AC623_08530 [Bacillus sp. FJAT-27231]|uniref:hypothetical protein n=1 Tax=Bacillus sp. FJAT-27231 TaxID=1679168 RepID=UPI0006711D1C|nr:hypothetical protein [Bacillus sp. FJAT-27231]KMY54009.1 hypothetical protein AC623_08530 [Bacillus sp. FJAT-27231]